MAVRLVREYARNQFYPESSEMKGKNTRDSFFLRDGVYDSSRKAAEERVYAWCRMAAFRGFSCVGDRVFWLDVFAGGVLWNMRLPKEPGGIECGDAGFRDFPVGRGAHAASDSRKRHSGRCSKSLFFPLCGHSVLPTCILNLPNCQALHNTRGQRFMIATEKTGIFKRCSEYRIMSRLRER